MIDQPGSGKKHIHPILTALNETMADDDDKPYRLLLNESITDTFRQVLAIGKQEPGLIPQILRFSTIQKRSAARREKFRLSGLQVPPVIMLSVTQRCNLSCAGCYMHARGKTNTQELSGNQLSALVTEAEELGVSFMVFAGGEPFVRKNEILDLARDHPAMIFAAYTNGLLIDESLVTEMAGLRNLVPILSIEGGEDVTDARRGAGVHQNVMQVFEYLKTRKVFFGCSVTVSRENYEIVTGEPFIRTMLNAGCRLFSFVEYVPIKPGTEDLIISEDQRKNLISRLNEWSRRHPAIFLGFPGDENRFGGCLSAGRGFIHINTSGDLEPCPAAPFSDVNISQMSLREALKSDFLRTLRSYHELLKESEGGCALWNNREWVKEILKQETHPQQ